MSSKVLVVGRTGQLACELRRLAWPARLTAAFFERPEIDLAQPEEACRFVVDARPAIVVNAAAYTAVDAAETDSEMAFTVNRDAPAALADACCQIGAPLIHISTDYVFDGSKTGAYREDDPISPLSVYGASKAEGEAAIRERHDRHVIIRTAWLYSPFGLNFVKTMLSLGAERDRLRIVNDQQGSPTAAADLAAAVITVCAALSDGREDGFGTFHFRGGGTTTWYDFACEIFRNAWRRGLKVPDFIEPIHTKDYPTPAQRPRNSVLHCGKIARTYGIVAPPWEDSLAPCIDEIVAATPQSIAPGALR
ncbi:MAG TPA: dTDP-4-dehydrorhamnose reductase [Stellaceae bacterium]|nr:dTDP-4-dehydrorhamnose reductase [Stellaceae bacterium]